MWHFLSGPVLQTKTSKNTLEHKACKTKTQPLKIVLLCVCDVLLQRTLRFFQNPLPPKAFIATVTAAMQLASMYHASKTAWSMSYWKSSHSHAAASASPCTRQRCRICQTCRYSNEGGRSGSTRRPVKHCFHHARKMLHLTSRSWRRSCNRSNTKCPSKVRNLRIILAKKCCVYMVI